MRSLLVASGLSIALLVPAMAETPRSPVQLVPHRAVYDLSLLRSEGSGASTAREGASPWISAATPAKAIR